MYVMKKFRLNSDNFKMSFFVVIEMFLKDRIFKIGA